MLLLHSYPSKNTDHDAIKERSYKEIKIHSTDVATIKLWHLKIRQILADVPLEGGKLFSCSVLSHNQQ